MSYLVRSSRSIPVNLPVEGLSPFLDEKTGGTEKFSDFPKMNKDFQGMNGHLLVVLPAPTVSSLRRIPLQIF